MTDTAIEWRATNLVALGEELRDKIARVTRQFEQRASTARGQDEMGRLRARLSQIVESIQTSYRTHLERMSEDEQTRDETLYDQTLAGIDMHRLVFRGDRRALAELLADAEFSSTVNRLLAELKPHNARKELLTKALKISRGMMPTVYQVVDHCARTLELTSDIEVYVNQDSHFNAACYPPTKDKVLLMLTSSLLKKFSGEELTFVIGHELGHYLFEHTRFPVDYILKNNGGRLAPLHAMKLYAWMRNSEITADRVGMVCCRSFDVAANTFFKLSSGITSSVFQFSVKEYLAQLDDLRSEVASQESDPQDWFSPHPFNPMRLKALEVFTKGQPYRELIGSNGGTPSCPKTQTNSRSARRGRFDRHQPVASPRAGVGGDVGDSSSPYAQGKHRPATGCHAPERKPGSRPGPHLDQNVLARCAAVAPASILDLLETRARTNDEIMPAWCRQTED